jgi:hypothetical protein
MLISSQVGAGFEIAHHRLGKKVEMMDRAKKRVLAGANPMDAFVQLRPSCRVATTPALRESLLE